MVSERVIPVSLAPRHELVRAWLTGVRFEALPSVHEWDGDASGSSEIDGRALRLQGRMGWAETVAAVEHVEDWRVTVRLAGPLAGRRVTDQAGPDDEAAAMTAWRRWRERLTITL